MYLSLSFVSINDQTILKTSHHEFDPEFLYLWQKIDGLSIFTSKSHSRLQ
jgi:hypothetical protein